MRTARDRLDVFKENSALAFIKYGLAAINFIVQTGNQAKAYVLPAVPDGQLALTVGCTPHHQGKVSVRLMDTVGVFARATPHLLREYFSLPFERSRQLHQTQKLGTMTVAVGSTCVTRQVENFVG